MAGGFLPVQVAGLVGVSTGSPELHPAWGQDRLSTFCRQDCPQWREHTQETAGNSDNQNRKGAASHFPGGHGHTLPKYLEGLEALEPEAQVGLGEIHTPLTPWTVGCDY